MGITAIGGHVSDIVPAKPPHTTVEETEHGLLITTRFKRNASTWPTIASTAVLAAVSADALLRGIRVAAAAPGEA